MADTVSPEATRWLAATGAAAAGAAATTAAAAAAPVGMVSVWPMRILAALARLFARVIAATEDPVRVAMWPTVSPLRTTYCSSAWAAPAAATDATARTSVAPVPVTTRRRSRPGPVRPAPADCASSKRPKASGRAVAWCVMV